MSEPEISRVDDDLPQAQVRPRQWVLSVVWIVPVVAAIVAGWLVYDRYRQYGPDITIRFRDGSGVRPGQTPVLYRGVPVAEVTRVTLSEDQRSVEVRARVQRSASSIAREGSGFWIVRPEVGLEQVQGL